MDFCNKFFGKCLTLGFIGVDIRMETVTPHNFKTLAHITLSSELHELWNSGVVLWNSGQFNTNWGLYHGFKEINKKSFYGYSEAFALHNGGFTPTGILQTVAIP